MVRKTLIAVCIVLALPFAASVAGADEQYPPDGRGSTVPAPPPSESPAPEGAAPSDDRALARTGTDTAALAGLGAVLVVGGAAGAVAGRRRRAA